MYDDIFVNFFDSIIRSILTFFTGVFNQLMNFLNMKIFTKIPIPYIDKSGMSENPLWWMIENIGKLFQTAFVTLINGFIDMFRIPQNITVLNVLFNPVTFIFVLGYIATVNVVMSWKN